MLLEVAADLHIHSALSPCAEREMTPPALLELAARRGLGLLAITDHNSAQNVEAFMRKALEYGITVLPGMEVQTREEVHIVCLFPGLGEVKALEEVVYRHLPDRLNDERYFGPQEKVDAQGQVIGREERLLLTSTDLSVDQVRAIVKDLKGLFIPAHVDRRSFSLISNLGFIPEELAPDAVEISRHLGPKEAKRRYPELNKFTLVSSSDAHRLEEILPRRTVFMVEEISFSEIIRALRGHDGRKVVVLAEG